MAVAAVVAVAVAVAVAVVAVAVVAVAVAISVAIVRGGGKKIKENNQHDAPMNSFIYDSQQKV